MGGGASLASLVDDATADELKGACAHLTSQDRERLASILSGPAADPSCPPAAIPHAPLSARQTKENTHLEALIAAAEEGLVEATKKEQDPWKYCSTGSIAAALKTEEGKSPDTVLIKNTWLIEQYEKGHVLPKRQALPSDSFWTERELPQGSWSAALKMPSSYGPTARDAYGQATARETKYFRTIAISYCWAKAEHPDPNGEQLKRFIGPVCDKYKKCPLWAGSSDEQGVFLDWCSLFQAERSTTEQEAFGRSLRHINIWYAHSETLVLLLTQVPSGVRPYKERGWPCFEESVSQMISPPHLLLNLGGLPEEYQSESWWTHTDEEGDWGWYNLMERQGCCTVNRIPPVLPEQFARLLATRAFTNGADSLFVAKKYALTIVEVLHSTDKLDFSNLAWGYEGAEELSALSQCFPLCSNATRLDLNDNFIADLPPGCFASLAALNKLNLCQNALALLPPGCFTSCATLKILQLRGNQIAELQASCLDGLVALETLNLSENQIAALSSGCFTSLPALKDLDLCDNRIAALPPGCFASLAALEILHLRRNKITELQAGCFDGLVAVKTLYLAENRIAALASGLFATLPTLKVLDLSANEIAELRVDIFDGMHELSDLHLGANPIERPEAAASWHEKYYEEIDDEIPIIGDGLKEFLNLVRTGK